MEEKKIPAEAATQQAAEEAERRKHPRTAIMWEESIPARKRYNEKLREYPSLNGEGMQLKRAALWQLVSCGLSDVLIDTLLKDDSGISDEDIGLYASLVMITSEDFFFDQLYQKQLPADEISEKAAFYLLTKKYQQQGTDPEYLPFRLEAIMSQFQTFLSQMQKRESERSSEALSQSEDLWKMKFLQMRTRQRIKTDKLKEQRDRARKELDITLNRLQRTEDTLEKTRDQIRKMEEGTKDHILSSLPEPAGREAASGRKDKGFLARYREQKSRQEIMDERQKRKQKAEEWLRGDGFSEEQMVIVRRACLSDLPLKSLEKICDPHLKPENMAALETFLMKQEIIYPGGS